MEQPPDVGQQGLQGDEVNALSSQLEALMPMTPPPAAHAIEPVASQTTPASLQAKGLGIIYKKIQDEKMITEDDFAFIEKCTGEGALISSGPRSDTVEMRKRKIQEHLEKAWQSVLELSSGRRRQRFGVPEDYHVPKKFANFEEVKACLRQLIQDDYPFTNNILRMVAKDVQGAAGMYSSVDHLLCVRICNFFRVYIVPW